MDSSCSSAVMLPGAGIVAQQWYVVEDVRVRFYLQCVDTAELGQGRRGQVAI